MMSKTVNMWGGYECRVVKTHLNIRNQQIRIVKYIQIAIYKAHSNHKPKSITSTHTYKHTHKKVIQT